MTFADLLLPLELSFIRQALFVAALVGATAALLSCFLVLKGWALLGDAVSHAVLPGVVGAYALGLPFAVGAFAAGLFAALSVGYLRENSRIKEDTVIGVVFAGMFALGLVLYTRIETDVHLDHILFGDVLGVLPGDVWLVSAIAALTVVVMGLRWRDLALHTFDATHARAIGLPVRRLHYGFLVLLSLAIVAALKTVGIILAVALLITPGAVAFLLADRLPVMLAVSVGVAVSASVVGVYASVFIDSAPAPTIVLVLAALFVLAFVFAPRRGILAARRAARASLAASRGATN